MTSKSDQDSGKRDESPENKGETSGKGKPTANPVFQLNSSDNPGTPLVAATLNGDNYSTWDRSIKTALRAKKS